MSSRRGVDFNHILGFLNIVIATVTVVAYSRVGGNEYLSGDSVLLSTLLAAQTQLALFIERRRRDPFVIVVAFILVLYYLLRVLTLLLVPFSFVLDRFPYVAADSTNALLFMLIANTFLYAGFLSRSVAQELPARDEAWGPRAPAQVLVLVVMAMIIIYTRGTMWSMDSLPRAFLFVVMFFAQSFIFVMSLTYYVVLRHRLDWRFRAALILLLMLEMLLHTLAGSRSAFVGIFQNVLIVCLAFRSSLLVPRKLVVAGALASPFVIGALVGAFVVSTYTRAVGSAGGTPFANAVEAAQTAGDRLTPDYVLQSGLPVVLSRAGFFDYSAEVMAHRAQYASIVNFPTYARSITDNMLTPGFDLFDQPKISNALRFVYEDLGKPSKIISAEEYQSDQLGIYGEWFILFGYASLPLFFLTGVLVKRIYGAMNDADPFLRTIKRAIVMTLFVEMFNSFGFDWVVMDVVPLVVSLWVYKRFFATQRDLPMPASAPA